MAGKSKEQLEHEADVAHKAKVDADNKKAAAGQAKQEKALAQTPLTDEERVFVKRIEPMLEEGRRIMQPSPAEILRYSQLIKRIDVKKAKKS